MLKCHEVVESVDQFLDGAITRRQRLAIKIHLLMCHHCRRYMRQLRALLRAIPFMHNRASDAEVSLVMEHIHEHQANHP